ncbi:conserved hypothetical protein [Ricinus communis]|uniref:HTH merR-type domain-containing protein n=1 Tax=Ricinus communis TaxID=3988 RepID=B9TDN9_RICCO|nr:conserved hypothetical protein [Ricinus communis]
MGEATARGNIPLLVGGTMLYFNALQHGLSNLPEADPTVRAQLIARAEEVGWPAMHEELQRVDPETAARLQPNDAQRIERALEVFLVSGRPMSELLRENKASEFPYRLLKIALLPSDRAVLHQRIAQRFDLMLEQGMIEEVQTLRERYALNPSMPSMRCVGYRQTWDYLEGEIDKKSLREQGIASTRQLAKRQLTWLRGMKDIEQLDSTGISRATLNNYIALGLLPRPVVASPGEDAQTRARQIGYFPENTLSRIERIKQLKKDGVAMQEIARQLQLEGFEMSQTEAVETPQSQSKAIEVRTLPETGPLRLTIDQVPYPAYMVNYNLEINWYNEEARKMLLGNFDKLPSDTKERSVLDFFNRGSYGSQLQNREAFAQLHMQMGRERVASVLGNASLGVTGTLAGVNGASSNPIAELPLQLKGTDGKEEYYRVYASYFREGILVIYAHERRGCEWFVGAAGTP